MKEKCVWVMQERWTMTDLIIAAVVAVIAMQSAEPNKGDGHACAQTGGGT